MKLITLILAVLLNVFTVFSQNHIDFNLKYSAPYATYDFLAKISDNYPDNALKTIFMQSKYNTDDLRKKIAEFEQLSVDYNYAFNQYPYPLKAGLMSRDILEKNLAASETVNDFIYKSLGIIPFEDLSRFSEILKKFVPIYQELIFEPNQEGFKVQKNNLEEYITTNQFEKYFQVGLSFYNTKWDNNIPFELCLVPSLEKNSLGAKAFINVAICEASLDLKDHQTFFSVAMHEIYHVIYDNQSLEMKNNLQKWFDDTKSKNSQYALLLLNEVLATALGNGYVMEQITGKIDENDWYNNKYITAMAKEIYPVVKQYIENKKPMDEAFIKAYVKIYDTKFPQWVNELNHIFAYRYIVADTTDDWRYLRRTYRKYSYNRLGAPITASEVEKVKTMRITKVFVISENHKNTLGLIQDSFDELKQEKLNYKDEFIKVFTLNDNTKLFIINRYKTTTEDLMNNYFPKKVIQ